MEAGPPRGTLSSCFSTAPLRGSSVLLFPFPCYMLLGAGARASIAGELPTGKLRTGDAPTSSRRRYPQSHELVVLGGDVLS